MERVLRLTARTENYSKEVNDILLVTAFNPAFKNLPQAIRRNYELLTICRGTGNNQKFLPGPFVSFRCMRKLKKHNI